MDEEKKTEKLIYRIQHSYIAMPFTSIPIMNVADFADSSEESKTNYALMHQGAEELNVSIICDDAHIKTLRKCLGLPEIPVKRRKHCNRKRFKKILMANRYSRNKAEDICSIISKCNDGSSYMKELEMFSHLLV